MQQKSIENYQNFIWEKTCSYDRLHIIIFYFGRLVVKKFDGDTFCSYCKE